MKVCHVIGHVWATKKDENLNGNKLMVVQSTIDNKDDIFVAADYVGAGISDTVLVTTGSSARILSNNNAPIDAAIVGVVDALEMQKEE
ncbi:MAG: EutN/CcmL family microcompartment protein [Erysipelotrichales bacterium]